MGHPDPHFRSSIVAATTTMGLEAMSTEPAAAVSRDVYSVIVSYSFNFAVVSSVAAIAEQSSRKLS